MLLHQEVWVQTPENPNYADGENRLQEIFSIVQGVPSNMDLIRRLGVAQSDVYSHKMVELLAVESSM